MAYHPRSFSSMWIGLSLLSNIMKYDVKFQSEAKMSDVKIFEWKEYFQIRKCSSKGKFSNYFYHMTSRLGVK